MVKTAVHSQTDILMLILFFVILAFRSTAISHVVVQALLLSSSTAVHFAFCFLSVLFYVGSSIRKQYEVLHEQNWFKPLAVCLLIVPRQFFCCSSSLFMLSGNIMWRFCHYLFLISPPFGASRVLHFVTVALA